MTASALPSPAAPFGPDAVAGLRVLVTAGQQHRVVERAQLGDGQIDADVHVRPELHTFGLELCEAPVEHRLLELEVRNSVAEQTADAIRLLEYRDRVPDARQLDGHFEPGPAGAHDQDLHAPCSV